MKKLIVPSDFSNGAWNALLYAVDLGEALEIREILIINSYHAPHAGAATLVSIDRIMKKDSEEGLEKLKNRIERQEFSERFNFQYKSIHTGLPEAVNSQVDDYNSRLVVMGSLGETGLVEKLFGSNASDVGLTAKCPVIVIPPKAKFDNCRNVILGSDYHHVAEKNLQILHTICSLDPSTNLQIVHVNNDGAHPKASLGLDDIPHTIKELSGDDVGATLDAYVSETNTDLLVVINKDSGFFENLFHRSLTKKLALLGHVPLLILKQQD